MHRYKVKFTDEDGHKNVETIEASDAGGAFAKCQKLYPGSVMKLAIRDGAFWGGFGKTEYIPPQVQRDPVKEPRPCRPPKRDEKDGTMPFYDEVVRK